MNNTAIQKMIRIMEETMSDSRCDIIIARTIKAQINLAKGLLETERQQIMDAYICGCNDTYGIDEKIEGYDEKEAEYYFNEHYKIIIE